MLHIITAALKTLSACRWHRRRPPAEIRPAFFRYAAAGLFVDLSLTPKRIQALMGHSTIGVTFDTYGHLFAAPDEDAAAMQRLQATLIS